MSTKSPSRFIDRNQLKPDYGISPSFAYKLERKGKFPKRCNLNPEKDGRPVTRWLREELDQWLEDRLKSA